MHTFDVYCLLLFVVVFFILCLPWIGSWTKPNQNKVLLLCVQIRFCMVATFGKYTSLKASARWKALYILLLLPPPGCVSSLVTMTSATATQNKRPVVIHTVSTTNFHFTLVWCSFCWPRGWFWFVHVNVRTEFVLYRWCMLGRSLNVSCT